MRQFPQEPSAESDATNPADVTGPQEPSAESDATNPADVTGPQEPSAELDATNPADMTGPQEPSAESDDTNPAGMTTRPRRKCKQTKFFQATWSDDESESIDDSDMDSTYQPRKTTSKNKQKKGV